MPQKYIKKKIPAYTEEDMHNAIKEVKDNQLSMYAASKKYKIPSTTLYDTIKQHYSTNIVGRPLAIPLEEENRLAEAIKTMEKWGFGLSREEVLNLVAEFIKANNIDTPFTNNKPGKDWFTNFRKRHNLSIKKAQPVEYVRKKMTDPFVIFEYFKLLEETMTDLKLFQTPHLIWNLDETSLSLDPTRTKVVGAINKPCSRTTCGTGKENITVLTAVSASGKKITPLIVFKGKNVWDQWMADTENYDFELSYAASQKGWMETEIFHNYLEKILIPAIGDERPVLLIYDGHATHVDVKVLELATQNDVTILKLPPHTSHLLQPLDLAVFKSFKTKWDAKLVQWQRHNVGTKMPKNIFAQTFAETWQEINPDVIRSGFRKAGIHPFDSHVIPENKYDPAVYKRFQEKKSEAQAQLRPNNPDSLKKLCVDVFNKELQIPEESIISCPENTNSGAKNVILLSEYSKKDTANRSFIANQTQDLPKCLRSDLLQPQEKNTPKINIISDKKVTFEELLLEQIRQDKKSNATIKKKRIAKGAEVFTASLMKKKIAEEKEKQEVTKDVPKKRNLKGKEKLKGKQTTTVDNVKPGPSGVKKGISKNKGKNKPKRQRKDSDSSLTNISDIMSIYSETECVDYTDLEILDDFWDETNDFDIQLQESKSQKVDTENPSQQQITSESADNDIKIMSEEDFNIPKNKEKGKGKGKKTKTGKENKNSKEDYDMKDNSEDRNLKIRKTAEETKHKTQVSLIKLKTDKVPEREAKNKNKRSLINLNIDKIPEKKNKNHIKGNGNLTKLKTDKILENETKDKNERHENNLIMLTTDKIPEDTNDTEIYNKNGKYRLNDSVLVRYFVRKRWIYYVGFIENKIKKDDETYYTVNFLKTIKKTQKPYLTFVQTKRKDKDEIIDALIVKKIILQRNNEKEFILPDENDKTFF